jgi:hypothetical protein
MVSISKRGFISPSLVFAIRRRIVLVPMSIEATLLVKIGSDVTTEFLWNDLGCQLGMKDLEECRSNLISIVSWILTDKATYRSMVGPFIFGREETARKLRHSPGIGDAPTASSLAGAGLIRAGASDFVFF